MNAKKARALRRLAHAQEEKEQALRLARERRACSWSWSSPPFEGKPVAVGDQYLFYDGEMYTRFPWTPGERYVFNVFEDGELIGSSAVEIHPPSVLAQTRQFAKSYTDGSLPLGGPYLHELDRHTRIAMMSSVYIAPHKPARVFFALVEPIKRLELPTYALHLNQRAGSIAGRRYAVGATVSPLVSAKRGEARRS
jgi:hypothetical protein